MSASKLDAMYRSFLLTKFFTKGWGKPENLRRLFEFRKVVSNRDECFKLIERDYPVTITKEQNLTDCKLLEGYFLSPLERYLPGIVPEEVQKAHFQALLPVHWPTPGVKPVCLHLAGTGDHFFWRRRNLMVKPLLKEAGVGGIILENPFYGLRKPIDQVRSSLHNVSDIFVMGGCLILEALVLFHWCERLGLGPLGVTGLSMGGHMASLAATNWPKPLVLVPCLSWSTASAVFLEGVMSHSINWDLLEDQYLSDGVYREKLSKMVTIVDEAFLAGKKFARTYSQTIDKNPNAQTIDPKAQTMSASIDKTLETTLDIVTVNEPKNPKIYEATPNNLGVVEVYKSTMNTTKTKEDGSNGSYSIEQIKNLEEDLRKLLDEKVISQDLYNKLTSNEKFELDAEDIECINKLNAKERIKDILIRCKVAEIKTDAHTHTQQKKTEHPQQIDSKTTRDSTLSKPKSDQTISVVATDKTKLIKSDPIVSVVPVDKTKVKTRKWHVSDLTTDLWMHLPFLRFSGKKIDISKIHWRDREALQFMRGIMDECTHLSNFSIPYDTSLIIAVCAKHDAYVPRADVGTLEEIWPGAEVRYVDAGHVSAYILHQSLFRSCIKEAFERSKKKWVNGKHID